MKNKKASAFTDGKARWSEEEKASATEPQALCRTCRPDAVTQQTLPKQRRAGKDMSALQTYTAC